MGLKLLFIYFFYKQEMGEMKGSAAGKTLQSSSWFQ